MAEFMFPNVVYRATVYRTGEMVFKNGVKNIQAAAYNGARTADRKGDYLHQFGHRNFSLVGHN